MLPFLWVGVLIICSKSKSWVKESTKICSSAILAAHSSLFMWGKLKSPKTATLWSLGEVAAACVVPLNLLTIQLPAVEVGLKYLEPLGGKYKRMTPKLLVILLNKQLKQKSSILASKNSNISRKQIWAASNRPPCLPSLRSHLIITEYGKPQKIIESDVESSSHVSTRQTKAGHFRERSSTKLGRLCNLTMLCTLNRKIFSATYVFIPR